MVGVPLARRSKRRAHRIPHRLEAVVDYARLGWASCWGAHPLREGQRACSCDRVGCPDPGAHPLSPAWRMQATTDTAQLTQVVGAGTRGQRGPAHRTRIRRVRRPGGDRNVRPHLAGVTSGPVAVNGDRVLFRGHRGNPEDEDEWWTSSIDHAPETIESNPGLRWHCRDSYVLAPPSSLVGGGSVKWLRPPDGRPLPDPLRVLDVLAD